MNRSEVFQREPELGLVAHRDDVVNLATPDAAEDRVETHVADGAVRVVDELAELIPPETATAHRHASHRKGRTVSSREEMERLAAKTPVSSHDAEAVVSRINQAFAAGRLTGGEREERVQAAHRASYLVQLMPLVADLPPAPVPPWKHWAESVYFWTAGIPAGLILAVTPVSVIVTFSGGIMWAKAAAIAVSMILGLFIAVVSACKAAETYDRKHGRR